MAGITPQLRASLRYARSSVVSPMMGVRGRKRETILAVPPVRVQTTIAFAFRSFASVQAEWERASEEFLIA